MEVGVFEARNRFSELVEAAERGEETVILKRGKAVARLSPVGESPAEAMTRRMAALEATDDLRARYKGPKRTAEETRRDRDEGRRY